VTSVNLARSNVTAEGMRQLIALPKLEMLDVSETPRGAGMLEAVAQFPSLRTLQLRHCPWLSDAELAPLLQLTSLESLMISDANLTDASLELLAQCPNLTQLGVDHCTGITNAGVRRLAQSGRLQNVSINDCSQLTDESVCVLAASESLTALSACGIPMNRSSLRTITQGHPQVALTVNRFEIPEWQPLLDAGAQIGLNASYELSWIELDDRWHDPETIPAYSLAGEPERGKESLYAESDCRQLHMSGELLQCLAAVPELPKLYLRNLPVSDAQFAGLCRLPHLQMLSLENVPITDVGLQALADYESLESLWLLRLPLSGEGVVALAHLPRLTELALLSDQVTQSGIEAVARLQQLEALAIGDVSSASVCAEVGEMPNLSRLALVRATLTADDVERLCASSRLEELELLRANLLGDAFAPMVELSALQSIYLGRCEFDRTALQRLIDRRPDLQIYGAGGLSRGSPRAGMLPERGRLLGGIPLFIPPAPTSIH
jgi:Leucine-rich repeat (LRR) protein